MTIQASVNLLAEVIRKTPEYQKYKRSLAQFENNEELVKKLEQLNETAECNLKMHDEGILDDKDVKHYLSMREEFRNISEVTELEECEQDFSYLLKKICEETGRTASIDFLEGAGEED